MTSRHRWCFAGAIGLPWISITVYLLWIWPLPHGTSLWAEFGPYLLSLATGFPFIWLLSREPGRRWYIPAFLAGGYVLLCVYALAVLCGVRGVCL